MTNSISQSLKYILVTLWTVMLTAVTQTAYADYCTNPFSEYKRLLGYGTSFEPGSYIGSSEYTYSGEPAWNHLKVEFPNSISLTMGSEANANKFRQFRTYNHEPKANNSYLITNDLKRVFPNAKGLPITLSDSKCYYVPCNSSELGDFALTFKDKMFSAQRVRITYHFYLFNPDRNAVVHNNNRMCFFFENSRSNGPDAQVTIIPDGCAPVIKKLHNTNRIELPETAMDANGNYRTDIGYTMIVDISFYPNTDNFTVQPDAICVLGTHTSNDDDNYKIAYDNITVDIFPRYVCAEAIDVCSLEDPDKTVHATAYNFTPGTKLAWYLAGVNRNDLGAHSDTFRLGYSVVNDDRTSVFGMTYGEALKIIKDNFKAYDGVMVFVNSKIDGVDAMSTGHISTRCGECIDNSGQIEVYPKSGCSMPLSEVNDQLPLAKYHNGTTVYQPTNTTIYCVEGKTYITADRQLAETYNFEVGHTYTLHTEIYKEGQSKIPANLLGECDQTFTVTAKPLCPDDTLELHINKQSVSNLDINEAIWATKNKPITFYKTSPCLSEPGLSLTDLYYLTHDSTHVGCVEKPYTVYYHLSSLVNKSPLAVCPAKVVVNYPLGACPSSPLAVVVDDATDVKREKLLEYVKKGIYYEKPCGATIAEVPGLSVSTYSNFNYVNTHRGADCSIENPQPFKYNLSDANGDIYATCDATVIVTTGDCQPEVCGLMENFNVTVDPGKNTATPGASDEFPLLVAQRYYPQPGNLNWSDEYKIVGRYSTNPIKSDGTLDNSIHKDNNALNKPYPMGTTYVVWSLKLNGHTYYCHQDITVSTACSQKTLADYGVNISSTDVCYGQASSVTFSSSITPKPNAYLLVNGKREEFDTPVSLPAKTSAFTLNYTVKDAKTNCTYDGSYEMNVKKPTIDCSAPYNHISERAQDGTSAIPYPVASLGNCASQYTWHYRVTDKEGNTLKDKNGNNLEGNGDKNSDSLRTQFPDGYFKVHFELRINLTDDPQTCTKEYFYVPQLPACTSDQDEPAEFVNLVENDLSGWNLSYGIQDRFGDYYFDAASARDNYYVTLWGKQRLNCNESGITVGQQRRQTAFSDIPVQDWGCIIDRKLALNDQPLGDYIWADKWNNYFGHVTGTGTSFAPAYNSTTTAEQVENVYRVSYMTSPYTHNLQTCQSTDYSMAVTSGANAVIFGPQFSGSDVNAAHFYLNTDANAYDPLFGNNYPHTTSKAQYQLLKTIPDGYTSSMRVGASSVPFHNTGFLPKAGGAEFYGLNNFDLTTGNCASLTNHLANNNAGRLTYSFSDCDGAKVEAKTSPLDLSVAPAACAAADRAQTTFTVDENRPYLLVNYASVLGVDVSDFPLHKGDYCSDILATDNKTTSHVGREANFSILIEVQSGGEWITLPQSIINRAPKTQLGTGNNDLGNMTRNYETDYFHQANFNLDNSCSANPFGFGFSQTVIGASPLAGVVDGVADQHNEAFVTTGWQVLCVDLSDYVGQQVRFSVQNADCNDLAGHSCYHSAYTYFNARHFDFDLQYCPKTERIDVKLSKGFNDYAFRLISGTDTTPMIGVKGSAFSIENIYGQAGGQPRIQLYANGLMIIDTALVSTAPDVKINYQASAYTTDKKIVKFTDATTFAAPHHTVGKRVWKVYDASPSLNASTSPLPSNTNFTEYDAEEITVPIDNDGQWVYLIVENNICCSDTDSVFIYVADYQPAMSCTDQGRAVQESDFESGQIKIDGIFKIDMEACMEDPEVTFTARDADGNPVPNATIDLEHRSITGDFKEGYSTISITTTMCGASTTCTSKLYITKAFTPCYDEKKINLYSFDVVGNSFKDWKLSYGSQDRYFRSYYNDHEARKNHAEVCKGLKSMSNPIALYDHTNWNKNKSEGSFVAWVKQWNDFYGTVDGNTISAQGWSPSIDFNTKETKLEYLYNVDPTTNGGTDADFDRELRVVSTNANYHPIVSNFKTEGEIENYRFYIYKTNPGYDPLFGTVYKHTMLDDEYQLLPVMPSAGYPVIRVGSSTVPYHNNNTHFNFIQRGGCSEWTYINYHSPNANAGCGNVFPKFQKLYTEDMGNATVENYQPQTGLYVNLSLDKKYLGLAPNGHGTADRAQHTFIVDDDNKDLRFRYATIMSVDNTHTGCHYAERHVEWMYCGRGPNTSIILEVKHDGNWIQLPQSLHHMRAIERLPFPNSNDDARNVYFRREGFIYNGKGEVGQEDNYSTLVINHASNFGVFHQANFDVDPDKGCNRPKGLGYEELTKKVLTTDASSVNDAKFSQENHNESYITSGWQPVEVDLSAYVGDSVRMTIEAADCSDRDGSSKQHGAYIYVTSLPNKARIIYCKSTGMINGAAEKGYNNYYVRFVSSTESTPKILLQSNYFALKNPLKAEDTRIEIWGDNYLMTTDTLTEFTSAEFEAKQRCYFSYDFQRTGEHVDGTTYEYHIYNYDDKLTADVQPADDNTDFITFATDTVLDQTIDAKGQWVYFIAKNGDCCSDTAKKFIVPDPTLSFTCNETLDLGPISIDSCAISLKQVLEIAKTRGFVEPTSSFDCPAAKSIIYGYDDKNYQVVTDDQKFTKTSKAHFIKWRFTSASGSSDCPSHLKFTVELACPTGDWGEFRDFCSLSLDEIEKQGKTKLSFNPEEKYADCFLKKQIHWSTDASNVYNDVTTDMAVPISNAKHTFRYVIRQGDGAIKYCDKPFTVLTGKCPYATAQGSYTHNSVLATLVFKNNPYKYAELKDVFKVRAVADNKNVPADDCSNITWTAWNGDSETALDDYIVLNADNQYVGWKYKVDDTEYFCKYKVKSTYTCPTTQTVSFSNTNGTCAPKLGELVNMFEDQFGLIFPDSSEVLKWHYIKNNTYYPYDADERANTSNNGTGQQYLGWKVKIQSSEVVCNNKITGTFKCPQPKGKSAGDYYLTDNCAPTQADLVKFVENKLDVSFPDTIQQDCMQWWYYYNNNDKKVDREKYNPEKLVRLKNDQTVAVSFQVMTGLDECKYTIKMKLPPCPKNKDATLSDLYITDDKCYLTLDEVLTQTQAQGLSFPAYRTDCGWDSTFKYQLQGKSEISIKNGEPSDMADPQFPVTTGSNTHKIGWIYDMTTSYETISMNNCTGYKFKVVDRACPKLDTIKIDQPITKAEVLNMLSSINPKTYNLCNSDRTLQINQSSLRDNYAKGDTSIIEWNVAGKGYSCLQTLVVNPEPLVLNCETVAATRFESAYYSIPLPTLDLGSNSCTNPVTWTITVNDAEDNSGNDITSAFPWTVNGNYVNAKAPYGYTYWTFKAKKCGIESNTCTQKVLMIKAVEPCK